jgi:integrase
VTCFLAENWPTRCWICGGQGRDRTVDLPIFSRTLVPTELPGREVEVGDFELATPTGLEPATSAVTGRRANQLRYGAKRVVRIPNGIRTRVTAVKGRCPRPLDDGDLVSPSTINAVGDP